MRRLDLSKINFDLLKIKEIEIYINELVEELAKNGVIELENSEKDNKEGEWWYE